MILKHLAQRSFTEEMELSPEAELLLKETQFELACGLLWYSQTFWHLCKWLQVFSYL